VVQLSELAAVVRGALKHVVVQEPRRALTVAELTDTLDDTA
jgi:hypothetical protein